LFNIIPREQFYIANIRTTQQHDYNVKLNVKTKFIFSISGSASSIVKHNDAIKKLGLNLVYFTIADTVTPEVYAAAVRSPITSGAAVTGRDGLKSTIIPFLDEVELLAMKALAVNTIVNNAGKLYGYNSDAIGLKTALIKSIKTSVLNIKNSSDLWKRRRIRSSFSCFVGK